MYVTVYSDWPKARHCSRTSLCRES